MAEGQTIATATKGLSFNVDGGSSHVNVLVRVEEHDDGQLIISAKYGEEEIGKRVTSISNYKIVSR